MMPVEDYLNWAAYGDGYHKYSSSKEIRKFLMANKGKTVGMPGCYYWEEYNITINKFGWVDRAEKISKC